MQLKIEKTGKQLLLTMIRSREMEEYIRFHPDMIGYSEWSINC